MFTAMELIPVKTDMNYIKIINGRWHLNFKPFKEMTLNERNTLAEKIKES